MAILRFAAVTVLLLLFLICTTKTINAETDPYNLVPNPSFEEGTDFPLHWNLNSNKFCSIPESEYQSSVEWDQSFANTGSRSLGITNVYLPSPNTKTSVKVVSDFIQIPATSQYIFNGRTIGTTGNKGLSPEMTICFYNDSENILSETTITTNYPVSNQFWTVFYTSGPFNTFPEVTKIRIGLSAHCAWQFLPPGTPQDCTGAVWFDDIKLQKIGNITAHVFEDLNKNGVPDSGEQNLKGWGISFFKESNCIDSNVTTSGWTNQNGNITLGNTSFGNYSILETFWMLNQQNPPPYSIDAYQQGWRNTTSLCKNVTLDENNPSPLVNFGNIKGLIVPYLSQKDPAWGQEEYDHANTIGPFFCGTTIKGCGCAITSSAMLLKYYGVDKSPNGEPTTPKTLNDWLKFNHGYAFGALKWNSIAAYALKANQSFGTQKIKFTGVGQANNFTDLENELTNQRPVILEEPGHYILATQIQNPTYSINDPYFEDRKTLQSYSNIFKGTRKYEKTSTDLSALYIMTPSPTKILLTDESGKKLGEDPQTGQIFQEIPNGFYFVESIIKNADQENSEPNPASGITTLVILTPQKQNFNIQTFSSTNYQIDFSGYDKNGEISSKLLTIEKGEQESENFQIYYSPDSTSTSFDIWQKAEIDIIPGKDKNSINAGGGNVPIAILSKSINVKGINTFTIFAGIKKTQPSKDTKFIDVDRDKKDDLLIFFRANDLKPTPEDLLCLSGKTIFSTPFMGCTNIRVLGSNAP